MIKNFSKILFCFVITYGYPIDVMKPDIRIVNTTFTLIALIKICHCCKSQNATKILRNTHNATEARNRYTNDPLLLNSENAKIVFGINPTFTR